MQHRLARAAKPSDQQPGDDIVPEYDESENGEGANVEVADADQVTADQRPDHE